MFSFSSSSSPPSCETNIAQCAKFYPSTFFPNIITLDKTEANYGVQQAYSLLVGLGCSELSELLICLALSPECTSDGYRLPCVDLCEVVEAACSDAIQGEMLSDVACLLKCSR